MKVNFYENIDFGGDYYNFRDKLSNHITKRFELGFEAAKKARNSINSIEDLKEYVASKRKIFIDSIGGIPYDGNCPLNAVTTGVIEEEDLTIEKVIFNSRPDVYVTGTLYIPKKREEKSAAVLFQCGHSKLAKGWDQYQKDARIIASYGLIVFAIDPIGQGERYSYMEKGHADPMVAPCIEDHQYAGEQCVLAGDSIARYFIADAMKAVDYLQTRPEVDPDRIGATGNSGGGTATCHTILCDDRIKAAAPGTFITGRQEYFYTGNPQDSEQIWPGATINGLDHHEILMSFAPKPVLLLAVDSDFFPLEGTIDVYNDCARVWELFGAKDDLHLFVDHNVHNYSEIMAAEAGKFLAFALNGEVKEPEAKPVTALPLEMLNVTKSGQVKTEFPNAKIVFDENLMRIMQYQEHVNEEDGKMFLRKAVDFSREPVDFHMHYPLGNPIVEYGYVVDACMWFTQKQMPINALIFRKYGQSMDSCSLKICLWDKGTDDIESHIYKIRDLCEKGNAVVVIDLSGMGKNFPHALNSAYPAKGKFGIIDRAAKDLFTLGDSLCALRLFELEYSINALRKYFMSDSVSLYAEGKSTILAKLYQVLHSETDAECAQAESLMDIATTKYYMDYNCSGYIIPGILKYLKV